ncbi:MAG TPA: lipase family protein [Myxococcaceae bacterium]|nr:lipase family protein [Myxococcaceae bacterium]
MSIERIVAGACSDPFPVYPGLADLLAAAHLEAPFERDPMVAHVLGTCAGYAYGDTETVSTMMTRLGLDAHTCVRITQVVDTMFIYSTAYVFQSRCGRVVILCYRGTEPANLGNWLGDMDLGPDSSSMPIAGGAAELKVHGGFHRNVRATWWPVMQELSAALAGRSLADHGVSVPHPLEALHVCGHSLGAAMALLFSLKLSGEVGCSSVIERLRAVYTFGQPMALLAPLPPGIERLDQKVFRHLVKQDPIPALPAGTWGPFVHVGQEFRHLDGEWQRSASPVEQIPNMRKIPRIMFSFFDKQGRREGDQYAFSEHGPQHYLSALRPPEQVSEFGDRAKS